MKNPLEYYYTFHRKFHNKALTKNFEDQFLLIWFLLFDSSRSESDSSLNQPKVRFCGVSGQRFRSIRIPPRVINVFMHLAKKDKFWDNKGNSTKTWNIIHKRLLACYCHYLSVYCQNMLAKLELWYSNIYSQTLR